MMKLSSKTRPFRSRLDRLAWRFNQPVIKKPRLRQSVISDLFVWRKGGGWRTFFELTDISSVFCQATESTSARVLIFDRLGQQVEENFFEAPCYSRKLVDISELADSCRDSLGTFCVLHAKTPKLVSDLGSNLSERGYVSYCFGGSSLRSYVHGNLDAVGLGVSGEIERLAGTSFLTREYRLQHNLRKDKVYELAIVNASNRLQSVECDLFDATVIAKNEEVCSGISRLRPGTRYRRLHATLAPGGCHIFRINPNESGGDSVRVVIRSRLVMLRPLVFQTEKYQVNVFHG